jgi:integrase
LAIFFVQSGARLRHDLPRDRSLRRTFHLVRYRRKLPFAVLAAQLVPSRTHDCGGCMHLTAVWAGPDYKPTVRTHDLRHTFASHLVSKSESLHIVGKLLGHTQPQITARYAHLAIWEYTPTHEKARRVGAVNTKRDANHCHLTVDCCRSHFRGETYGERR